MNSHLSGKVIYITGASRGIGFATTELLLQEGATVIANARNIQSASDGLLALQEAWPDALILKYYDVTDDSAIKTAVREVQKQFGKIDGLVNNAGIMLDCAITMTSAYALQKLLDTNVKSAYSHLQLLSRLMLRNDTNELEKGAIVNLTSIVGDRGAKGQSAYSMSKASLVALTKSAAKELGPVNIRVNAVSPGFIETDMTKHYGQEKKQALRSQIPLNRLGKPKDVAQVIAFLLSANAQYVTGQVLGVDGAMSI